MKLKGLNSFDEAERYRGAEILIRKDILSRQDGDEYFWYELIGVRVYLDTGRYIGTIRHILPTGGHDIYVIGGEGGGEEFLIPAIHEVVKAIDLKERRMIIRLLEGLLDLNEV